jgi:hypothetical protein
MCVVDGIAAVRFVVVFSGLLERGALSGGD